MAFAGFDIPLQMDVAAEKMIYGLQGIDPSRRERLIKVIRKVMLCFNIDKCSSLFDNNDLPPVLMTLAPILSACSWSYHST